MQLAQAVIFAGGRGERLRPLTDNCPKPLVPVAGKPFLDHLLTKLHEEGITKALILTGYLGEMISDHYKNGFLGMDVTCLQTPEEWETGKRLLAAREHLDDHFFILYGDNFLVYTLAKMKAFYEEKKALATITVYRRQERSNISVDDTGRITVYDGKRQTPGTTHVEIGHMIFAKEALDYLPSENKNIASAFPGLIEKGELYGYETRQEYYSISELPRLKIAEEFLTPKKILLIDRDGVINKKAPKMQYVSSWDAFEFLPGAIAGMKLLSDSGYSFIIISNQAGIARGMLTMEGVQAINKKMSEQLAQEGIKIIGEYICPHHWEDGCACRKPKPGMLLSASKDHRLRLDTTYFIGDDTRDIQTAHNADSKGILVTEETFERKIDMDPVFVGKDVIDCAKYILGQKHS